MTRPKPTLKQILADLLEQAKADPGVGKPFNLSAGLCLHMKVKGDKLTLGISRYKVEPSLEEWKTVCRDAGLPIVEYRYMVGKNKRHYLIAEFDLVEQEKLPL